MEGGREGGKEGGREEKEEEEEEEANIRTWLELWTEKFVGLVHHYDLAFTKICYASICEIMHSTRSAY